MFPTFDRIKYLARKKGLSINGLEEKIGFSRNSLYSWKNSAPKPEKLNQVADYFGVSTDYLLGRTDNPAVAGEGQAEIDLDELDGRIMLFDGKPLTDDDKRAIKGIIEGYMNSKE